MNYGIIISYVIAGFLMITILTITYNVGFSNQEVTTTLMKKVHSQAITEMLMHDIPKIGYEKKMVLDPKFAVAKSDEISFYSNIDNEGAPEQVTWKYTDTPAPDTKNPHDHTLRRTVDGDVTVINLGITKFEIRYYDAYGKATPMATPVSSADFDKIRQIEIEMEVQSQFTISYRASDPGRFVTTSWKKRFSPVNLRPN